jgi:hypothetical protein
MLAVRFEDATATAIDTLLARVESELKGLPALETAAQRFADILYDSFEGSIVLARVFVTVPYGWLPRPNQAFVRDLLSERAFALLRSDTPVLSLVGTRGRKPEWNSRFDSRGHAGIPLASAEFVDSIPMIARLLKELGAAVEWAEDLDTAIVRQSIGKVAGLFYVEDARTAVDQRGRKIIAAQDFVVENDVRTVFGFGGTFAVARTFLAVVVFTSEWVPRRQTERLMSLANAFKAATIRHVRDGRIFV